MILLVFLCLLRYPKSGINYENAMKKIPLILLILYTACSPKEEKKVGKVKLLQKEQFTQVIDTADVLLVDVRTAPEYEAGFIAGAVNIDIKKADFEKRMNYFDRKVPIAVYCVKGGRSAKAAKKLAEMGFETVYDLKGGYAKWMKDGDKQ